jgi:outer membrane receptor protein involved in Fe transport
MSTKKAPGYSTVIDLNKIENSPERTLEQLLEFYAPGIHTARHERHGALIGTRGVLIDNNAKTLVMLDGQALNQRSHFGYTAPLQLPLMGDWKAVEIINGPGAIVHGSGAINGFINLIPKSGTEFPGLFVNTELGFVEGLEKVEAGYGIPYGDRKDLYLYGGVVGAEGTTRDEDWGSPSTPTNKDHYVFGHPAPSFKVASYWHHENFGLNFLLQETNINHGGDIDQSVKSDSGWHHGIIALRPKYTLDITDTDSLEFLGSFEFSEHNSFDEPGGQAQGGSEQHEEFKMIGRTTRFDKHSLAGGFLFGNRDFCPADSYLHSDPESSFESVAFGWREFGIFAEDVIELTDKWTASLGGRWDKVFYRSLLGYGLHPKDSSNFSLRLATAYEFDPETVLKFSYQEGFRYPDARYHAYYFEPMLNAIGLSMPTLEPETMSSYELNFSKKFPERKASVDLNAYYNTYKKMLHWHDFQEGDGYFPPGTVNYILYEDPSSPYGPGYYWFGEFTNARGDFDSIGGEVIVNWQPVDKTNVQFMYGYSRPENMEQLTNQGLNLTTDDTDEWIRYPKHQIKANITSLFLDDRLVLNVSMLYNDAYSTGDSSLLHPIYGRSRTVVDAMARYALTKGMFIKFGVKNLFECNVPGGTFRSDRPYLGELGMDKRFYYLELQWRF